MEQISFGAAEVDSGHLAEPPTTEQVRAAAEALALLAEPTRLQLLWILTTGEHDVSTLATTVGASATSVSQHLAKLRLAGLVQTRREGRRHLYTARGAHVRRVVLEALYFADHQLGGHSVHD